MNIFNILVLYNHGKYNRFVMQSYIAITNWLVNLIVCHQVGAISSSVSMEKVIGV